MGCCQQSLLPVPEILLDSVDQCDNSAGNLNQFPQDTQHSREENSFTSIERIDDSRIFDNYHPSRTETPKFNTQANEELTFADPEVELGIIPFTEGTDYHQQQMASPDIVEAEDSFKSPTNFTISSLDGQVKLVAGGQGDQVRYGEYEEQSQRSVTDLIKQMDAFFGSGAQAKLLPDEPRQTATALSKPVQKKKPPPIPKNFKF